MSFPRRLDEILAQVMIQRGYGDELSSAACEDAWKEVVGTPLAQWTAPTRLRNGVLEVLVDNSTILQELTFQKSQLLKSLSEHEAAQGIRDLRFRIGKV